MAREMALAGVDPSELKPPEPPKAPEGVEAKLQNFWYHYKPFILFGCFVLFLGFIFLHQMIVKDPPDYTVTFVSKLALYAPEKEALEEYLAMAGQDLDGDGKVEVQVDNLVPDLYSEVAPGIGAADRQKLNALLATGETMLFAFDREGYDAFMDTIAETTSEEYVFFAPLDTDSPMYDPDEHYWDWADDTRHQTEALAELPEHMLFGIRAPSGTASQKDAVRLYEEGKVFLEALAASATTD